MLITMITFRPKSCFSELLNEDNSLPKVINILLIERKVNNFFRHCHTDSVENPVEKPLKTFTNFFWKRHTGRLYKTLPEFCK